MGLWFMTGTHIIMRFMVLMGMRMALACTCHCSHKAVPLSSAHTGSHWVSKCNGSVMYQEHLLCLCALQAMQQLLLTLHVAVAAGSATATPPLPPFSNTTKAALDLRVDWILSRIRVSVRAGYMASI